MNAGKVFLGVLAGAAVGASIGILFAPYKGSKTRKIIAMKKDKYIDELDDKFNEFIGIITETFASMKGEASRLVKQGNLVTEEVEAEVIHAMPGKKQQVESIKK